MERWYAEMPREEEMLPKDKYTIFDKKEKHYRKSIHSMSFLAICWLLVVKGSMDDVDRLYSYRAAQVDSCQPACESPWFLGSEILHPTNDERPF